MDFIFFLTRHAPFWSVPVIAICLEFSYIYWIKDMRKACYSFILMGIFAGIWLLFYFFAGGPERSVQQLIELIGD
jgi:hypothetical protein